MTDAADRLIVALDFPTGDAARAMVELLGDSVGFYKVGHELLFGADGMALARELVAADKRVFLDAKLLDIGHTVERATAAIAATGVHCLTVHGHDAKTMEAAVAGRGDSSLRLLAVTVLTNLDADDLAQQGIEMPINQLVVHRARLARDAGFDGVIASGEEAGLIRTTLGPDFMIVTPGIRPAGVASDDQSRIMTPARAVAAGASHLVVGRPITQAVDPRTAAQRILEEVARAIP